MEGVDLVCAAFVKAERSNKVCRLGSDHRAPVLLYTIVHVLNMSNTHNGIGYCLYLRCE